MLLDQLDWWTSREKRANQCGKHHAMRGLSIWYTKYGTHVKLLILCDDYINGGIDRNIISELQTLPFYWQVAIYAQLIKLFTQTFRLDWSITFWWLLKKPLPDQKQNNLGTCKSSTFINLNLQPFSGHACHRKYLAVKIGCVHEFAPAKPKSVLNIGSSAVLLIWSICQKAGQ